MKINLMKTKRKNKNKNKNMQTQVMTVTPELAKFWLTYNDTNRKVRKGNTEYFANLIEQGEFKLTHQGMAFEGSERNPKRLQDGQHRCLAIIKTGQPQQMMVSWNCPPEMFACVDSGAMRSFKDLHGWDNATIALVKAIREIAKTSSRRVRLTLTEAEVVTAAFGDQMDDLMEKANTSRKGISTASTKAVVCILMKQYPDRADEILNVYKALTNIHFNEMPQIVQRLYTRLIAIEGGCDKARIERVLLSYAALNPENWKKGTLVMYHRPNDKMAELREWVAYQMELTSP
jgi:hypothetical protein